jgi:hypothetical protein
MKVKVITVSFPMELETDLQQFLNDNPFVDIVKTDYYSNIRFDKTDRGEIHTTYYEFVCVIFYN